MMDFSTWLSAQRASIVALQVDEGRYATHYHSRKRTYSARPEETSTTDPIATVDCFGGAVRIRVTIGGVECTFAPSWISGRGLSVVRQLPSAAPRALADDAHGHALAALRCAAERVFLRDLDLALDAVGERDQHIELGRLALCGGAASPTDLSDVLAASLGARAAA